MGYRTLWDSASVALVLQSHLEKVESAFQNRNKRVTESRGTRAREGWRNVHLPVVQRVFAFHAGRAVNRC